MNGSKPKNTLAALDALAGARSGSNCCTGMIGWMLIFTFYILIGVHFQAFFAVVMPLIKRRLGTYLGLIWIAVGFALLYNVVYNHILAILVKPGSPKDLARVEYLKTQAKKQKGGEKAIKTQDGNVAVVREVDDDRFEGLSVEIKKLARYRGKSVHNLGSAWDTRCHTCDMVKPARTHHCALCGSCVFCMDHHCLWINNCVGLDNQRYFLLYGFYLMLGCGYSLISIVSIWNHHFYHEHRQTMTFVVILDTATLVAMAIFNLWNFGFALFGLSKIEFWQQKGSDLKSEMQMLSSWRCNLYRIFGTQSFVQALSPSLRSLPFSGIEWSFLMKDMGFNEKGEKSNPSMTVSDQNAAAKKVEPEEEKLFEMDAEVEISL